jgi:glycosyltransferase involved in cell wall biosynthesis
MRILGVTNEFPTPHQPQRATFNREQFKALARDHAVRVIAPIAWTDEWTARRAGAAPLAAGRRSEIDGMLVEHPRVYAVPGMLRGLNGRFFRRSIRAAFRRALTDFRPDLVYATWAFPDGWAAVTLAKEAGLPAVLKVHGSDVLLLDHFPAKRRGTVEALRRADRVVAVSRDLAAKVVELGADPARVHLIYNGVDANVFRPGDRDEARSRLGLDAKRPTLIYIGNLLPVKGPDLLIEAAGRLTALGASFDLHIIGDGPMRAGLEQSAAAQGLADRVSFHGVVPHNQLPDWFRSADMLVLPSRSEGVPNVLLEAIACGTPFVACDVGGVSEVSHLGAGDLVAAENPAVLADTLSRRLNDPLRASPRAARSHLTAAAELTAVFEAALGQPASALPKSGEFARMAPTESLVKEHAAN